MPVTYLRFSPHSREQDTECHYTVKFLVGNFYEVFHEVDRFYENNEDNKNRIKL